MDLIGAQQVLRLVVALSAVTAIIGATEWLALRRHFMSTGIYSWDVQRLFTAKQPALIDKLFRYPTILIVPVIQLVFACVLLLPVLNERQVGVSCLIVSVCYFLLSHRGVDGFTGGDAMGKAVILTGAICFLIGTDTIAVFGLIFLTGQLLIAYSTPGWLRLFDPSWHNSEKIVGVMRTETFGTESVWKLLSSRPKFARFVSSGIAIWEALFVFYLFLPVPMLLPVLLIGLVFHGSNALVMGLNTFPWTFVGSYPAFVWCALALQDRMGLWTF